MDNLFTTFLYNQELLALGACDVSNPWIANIYYAFDLKRSIYFISSEDTRHSQMILRNPNISFSVAWFDKFNHNNRKSVQGNGICRIANLKESTNGIKLLYSKFPDLRNILTTDWIRSNLYKTKVWIIDINYIKYWDDELFGEEESQDYYLNNSNAK